METQNTVNKPANITSNAMSTPNANSTALMRYKASKYHYKIQNHLNVNYVTKGETIPEGYEKYLQPFQG
jgi:hypothetical protein